MRKLMNSSQRVIPGQAFERGREFLYVECDLADTYESSAIARNAFDYAPASARPTQGGVLDERIFITDSKSRRFMGISYRGDVAEWRQVITRFCQSQNRSWGRVQRDYFTVCGGECIPLNECQIEFV